ncbi:MAG: hypothetical protein GXO11_03965 [Epsilonproteobacteria bacterium]|nr:hypothetical protein [Campylobacterota bacterium]
MNTFLTLEAPYLAIMLFFLAITAFVTTRDFMPKVAFKRGMIGVATVFVIFIGWHYKITTDRMDTVKQLFSQGKTIICENKMRREVMPSVLVSKQYGWSLKGDVFTNPEYVRDFHTARCVEYIGPVPK